MPLQQRGWCPQIASGSGHGPEDDHSAQKGQKWSLQARLSTMQSKPTQKWAKENRSPQRAASIRTKSESQLSQKLPNPSRESSMECKAAMRPLQRLLRRKLEA